MPDTPPPPTESPTLALVMWVIAVLVPAIGSLIAGYFAWRNKIAELRKDAELHTEKQITDKQTQELNAVADHFQREREQQTEFYETILSEVHNLRDENSKLQRRLVELQLEVHELNTRLDFYENNPAANDSREMMRAIFDQALTTPAWVHDIGGNKWYVNDAYCDTFNIDRRHFWSPINIFGRYPIEHASRYSQNDLKVIESGVAIEFTESCRKRIMDPHCDEHITGRFRKVPVVIRDRPYVFGMLLNLLDDSDT